MDKSYLGNSTSLGAPQRTLSIPRVIEQLQRELDETDASLAHLISRLNNILGPETPVLKEVNQIDKEPPAACHLTHELETLVGRIHILGTQLSNLMHRLEI